MYRHILLPVAIDHRPNTEKAIEVARTLLDEGGRITALHVTEPIPGYVAQYLPEGHFEAARQELEATVRAELGDPQDIDVALVSGSAGTAINEFAAAHDVDCIVIASHRPGLQDYFLGSTAARVVRHARCNVHVVR